MEKISSGIKGLDEILKGGLIEKRSYLVRGAAGTGKTTYGFHFLLAGIENKDKCLFITMGEPVERLKENAETIGISLENIEFLDLSPGEEVFKNSKNYDFFISSEVEAGPLTKKIRETMKRVSPQRVFLDSMTMLQYLLNDVYQFRKQALSFIEYVNKHGATFLFTSEPTASMPDEELCFLTDGVINLEMEGRSRYISISKFRGADYRAGRHAFRITGEGVKIFPRLVPKDHGRLLPEQVLSSGIPGIDKLLRGGIEHGTVTIITGPSGIGKTTLGLQFMKEAAENGYRSVVYLFEESMDLLVKRSEGINIPVGSMMEHKDLDIIPIEPLRFSSDEFTSLVREEVEEKGTKIVMIDSVAGLRLSIRDDRIVERLHGIASYLRNMGVTLFFINEVESVTGDFKVTELHYSYISDNIIYLRYAEKKSEISRTIGVLKKRLGNFEKTIREFKITKDGLVVEGPLKNVTGILARMPEIQTEKK